MSKLLFVFDKNNDDYLDAIERKDRQEIKDTLIKAFEGGLEDNSDCGWRCSFGDSMDGDVFGIENADTIILATKAWNDEVRRNFTRMYDEYIAKWSAEFLPGNARAKGMDNQDTFHLRMAVSMLDNCFSPVCDMFVYLESENSFVTVISNELMEYICQNPELCVLTHVACYA